MKREIDYTTSLKLIVDTTALELKELAEAICSYKFEDESKQKRLLIDVININHAIFLSPSSVNPALPSRDISEIFLFAQEEKVLYLCEQLLKEKKEIDVNYQTEFVLGKSIYEGWAALHVAAFLGYPRIVNWLINQGADVFRKDDEDRDALEIAIKSFKLKPALVLLKEIKKYKFDVNYYCELLKEVIIKESHVPLEKYSFRSDDPSELVVELLKCGASFLQIPGSYIFAYNPYILELFLKATAKELCNLYKSNNLKNITFLLDSRALGKNNKRQLLENRLALDLMKEILYFFEVTEINKLLKANPELKQLEEVALQSIREEILETFEYVNSIQSDDKEKQKFCDAYNWRLKLISEKHTKVFEAMMCSLEIKQLNLTEMKVAYCLADLGNSGRDHRKAIFSSSDYRQRINNLCKFIEGSKSLESVTVACFPIFTQNEEDLFLKAIKNSESIKSIDLIVAPNYPDAVNNWLHLFDEKTSLLELKINNEVVIQRKVEISENVISMSLG